MNADCQQYADAIAYLGAVYLGGEFFAMKTPYGPVFFALTELRQFANGPFNGVRAQALIIRKAKPITEKFVYGIENAEGSIVGMFPTKDSAERSLILGDYCVAIDYTTGKEAYA